jgi:hypothetical protein
MRIKIAARRAEIPARSRTLVAKALAKFDEALECAPNWKALREAREAVAKQRS